MEIIEYIVLALFAIGLALFPLFIIYNVIVLLWEKFIGPLPSLSVNTGWFNGNLFSKIKQRDIEQVLSLQFSYYRMLSLEDKIRFEKRVAKFIAAKEFRGTEALPVTNEMIILISASAVQLTFGLKNYLFEHFDRIFIYPREFYSRIGKAYHKGETNLAGAIVLSWKHFSEGYSIANDNLNLGLHEMAHALRFDKYKSDGYDEFFSQYLDKWQMIAQTEFQKLKEHKPSFLREYGGTNFSEFFSVCVEYFFESPKEFKQVLPEIYGHLCILLNQDPAAGIVNFMQADNPHFHPDAGEPVKVFSRQPSALIPDLLFIPLYLGVFIYIFMNGIYSGMYFQMALTGALIIFPMILRIKNAKKKIIIFPDRIEMSSAYFKKLDEFFYFDDIVSFVIMQGGGSTRNNRITVNVIEKGRIRSHVITYIFDEDQEITILKEFLNSQNIPVKIESYGS